MRKTLALLVAFACLIFCAPTFGRGRDVGRPHRFAPEARDGGLVQIQSPTDGRTWAAWAYRNGAEFDLAISFTDRAGFWSEPVFVGLDDGSDQIQPALAVDRLGTVYLAFVDRASDVIVITALRAGTQVWSMRTALTEPAAHGRWPSLAVVGNRLVVAYRSGDEVQIMDLPLLPALSPAATTQGINDGPDPTGIIDDSGSDNGEESGNRNGGLPPLLPPQGGSGEEDDD
jgi:hypothetical protein